MVIQYIMYSSKFKNSIDCFVTRLLPRNHLRTEIRELYSDCNVDSFATELILKEYYVLLGAILHIVLR